MDYLLANPHPPEGKQDDWRELCKERFQATAYALCQLAKQNIWPEERWRPALQAWLNKKHHHSSWRYMAPTLVAAPDHLLQTLAHNISQWLRDIAGTFEGHEAIFSTLLQRILKLDYPSDANIRKPVTRAINHPVGHVTWALLDWWCRQSLEDHQGLPEELKSVFARLCDTRISKFRHGRVLLAARVIALFRVDRSWTMRHLLPLFDWQQSAEEARSAWEGFLWMPRPYHPLLEEIKPAFLASADHYAELGEHAEQYASLLALIALDMRDTFTQSEMAKAIRALPPSGLQETAKMLVRALEGAGDKRANYWKNRIIPYLHTVWPNDQRIITPGISYSFGRLCIAASEEFPAALDLLRAWLQPTPMSAHLIHRLRTDDLCTKFPEKALDFLALIIDDQTRFLAQELNGCLEDIREVNPDLEPEPRYETLMTYLRQRGL